MLRFNELTINFGDNIISFCGFAINTSGRAVTGLLNSDLSHMQPRRRVTGIQDLLLFYLDRDHSPLTPHQTI